MAGHTGTQQATLGVDASDGRELAPATINPGPELSQAIADAMASQTLGLRQVVDDAIAKQTQDTSDRSRSRGCTAEATSGRAPSRSASRPDVAIAFSPI
jgi:hypothetical protein